MRISQEGTGDTKVCPRRKPTATLLNTCPALKKRSLSKVVYNNHPVREDGGIGRAVHILYGTDWQLSAESARNNSLKIFS